VFVRGYQAGTPSKGHTDDAVNFGTAPRFFGPLSTEDVVKGIITEASFALPGGDIVAAMNAIWLR